MTRGPRLACVMAGLLATALLAAARPGLAQTPPAAPRAVLHEVIIDGASVFGRPEILWLLRLREGQPLPDTPAALAEALHKRYAADGYTCARVEASFDVTPGRLVLTVDEGRIDAVEFVGGAVSDAGRLRARFEVHPGDVYNQRRVDRALEALRTAAGGAVEASVGRQVLLRGSEEPVPAASCPLVQRAGRRVLAISLERRKGRFSLTGGAGSREDWYSPVDGLVPSLGFRATLFDARGFGRTFLTGYLTYKWARDEVGYALGAERPLGGDPRVSIGGEIHDLTASDDDWRLTTAEQSLVALGFHRSFRDYYQRHGYQLHAAVRVGASQEVEIAWRDDRHAPLDNRTDFSLFQDSRTFPDNAPATPGRLRAIVAAYTFDSRGALDEDTLRAFARHLLDGFFGGPAGDVPGVRLDWTSELAPRGFGGDFDFSRHVLDARAYSRPSPRQTLDARAIVGLSDGNLPLQRTFALGGIGTVRGYPFKDVAGGGMALLNAEYEVAVAPDLDRRQWGNLHGLVFLDAGRVWRPVDGSRPDWLVGAGVGVALGGLRVEFGWPLAGPSRPAQILVRFGRRF